MPNLTAVPQPDGTYLFRSDGLEIRCPLVADPAIVDREIVSHDRFVEYHRRDLSWAEPLGLCAVVETPGPGVHFVSGTDAAGKNIVVAYAHPDVVEAINQTHRVVPTTPAV